MTRKTTIALAAALIAGSTLAARADATIHDANTGLNTMYYYGPLADLDRQGLPISAQAKAYLKQHGASHAASSKRGNVYLLEDRASAYQVLDGSQDNKQSGHW